MTALPAKERLAGVVEPKCTCCLEPQELLSHVSLGALRRFCPATGSVYLDRGDGEYCVDRAATALAPASASGVAAVATASAPIATASTAGGALEAGDRVPDIVSDRPVRTDEKTRILLERATFA